MGGTAWTPAASWDNFFHAHQLSQLLGTSFRGWPDVLGLLESLNSSAPALRATEQDCLLGLVAVLLHSIPGLEQQKGTQAALRAYARAGQLRARAASVEHLDCRRNEMVNHGMFAHYPLLLG